MDNIRYWFKKSPLYFWIVLVFWKSVVEIFNFNPLREKILDILVYISFLILLTSRFIKSNIAESLNYNLMDALITGGFFLLASFFRNLVLIPARIYFEVWNNQDRNLWIAIEVLKKEFKKDKIIKGYGIEIINNRPFDYRVSIFMPYLEVDGVSFGELPNITRNHSLARRLEWKESPASFPFYDGYAKDNGGKPSFYLIHQKEEGYFITYGEYSEEANIMKPITKQINKSAIGELNVFLKAGEFGTPITLSYNFEINIDRYNNITYKLNKGTLST